MSSAKLITKECIIGKKYSYYHNEETKTEIMVEDKEKIGSNIQIGNKILKNVS
jgi:hypothetical protein